MAHLLKNIHNNFNINTYSIPVIVTFFLIISTSNLYSQKETFNWYFGNNAAISFMPDGKNPQVLTDCIMSQREGCATISDRNGNLLFYSDGTTVRDKNGKYISWGGGLGGGESSSRSVIIVPKPRSNRYYYVFTIDEFEHSFKNRNEWVDTTGLRYSVIDMIGKNGKPAIDSSKHNVLLLSNAVEKMITINHKNQVDIWLVAFNWKNNSFYTYLITKDSIQTPIITKRSEDVILDPRGAAGFNLEYDIQHKKLINCMKNNSSFEVFNFDNATGKINVQNQIIIPSFDTAFSENGVDSSSMFVPYSAALSGDGTKLYASCYRRRIYQFDLSSNNINNILDSRKIIADSASGDGAFGTIRKGPNDKIYVTSEMSEYLSVIDEPNKSGNDCNFIKNAIHLKGGKSRMGLPIMMNFSVPPCDFTGYAGGDKTLCYGGNTQLGDNADTTNFAFKWTPSDFLSNPYILNPICTPTKTTQYVLEITDMELNCTDYDTITVQVNMPPEVQKSADIATCQGTPVTIGNAANSDAYTYSWLPATFLDDANAKNPICTPETNMTYILTIVNQNTGCQNHDTIEVTLKEITDLKIIGSIFICQGKTTTLTVSEEFSSYLWSTGETTRSITVNTANTYSVQVVDNEGCKGSALFEVKNFSAESVKIIAPNTICTGKSQVLSTEEIYDAYLWSTGETTPTIEITFGGTYWVQVTNINGCSANDTVEISQSNISYEITDKINFGSQCGSAILHEYLVINNTGNTAFSVSNISFSSENADLSCFTLEEKTYPLLIPNNTSDSIKITFHSGSNEICADSLLININLPCEKLLSVPVYGNSFSCSIDAASHDFTSIPGDSLLIPITFKMNNNSSIDTNFSFSFDYTYNPTLLQIATVQHGEIIAKKTHNDSLEVLTISKNINTKSATYSLNLRGRTFMGNAAKTSLKLDNFNSEFACITFNKDVLNTLELIGCAIDLRPIEFFNPTEMNILSSNSAKIVYEVATEENHALQLQLFDVNGNLLDKLTWQRQASIFERKLFYFDIENYSAGAYFILLQSNNYHIAKPVVIMK